MITTWDGPYGAMLIAASDSGITFIDWVDSPYSSRVTGNGGSEFIVEAMDQLKQYFAGRRVSFDVPLDPSGTPFQQTVWDELQRIPFGEVITYGELALRIGRPTSSRAVGGANGRNPISIMIPCHRVIGSNGQLTGYAGGLAAKTKLLEHEGLVV